MVPDEWHEVSGLQNRVRRFQNPPGTREGIDWSYIQPTRNGNYYSYKITKNMKTLFFFACLLRYRFCNSTATLFAGNGTITR